MLSGEVKSATNWIQIILPNNVTVELPKNWTLMTEKQRVTIDTFAQVQAEKIGSHDYSSDFNFAANYFDEHGNTSALINVRYYPNGTIKQNKVISALPAEIKGYDASVHNEISKAMKLAGAKLTTWNGTKKQVFLGLVAFVTEYQRSTPTGGADFVERLVRFYNGSKSFTITVSYRVDQEFLLKPICDKIITTIQAK